MPERKSLEPVLSSQAVAFLVALPKARQRKLIGLISQLAENPSQIGDYSEPDDAGRRRARSPVSAHPRPCDRILGGSCR